MEDVKEKGKPGRKKLAESEKKKSNSMRFSPATIDMLREMAELNGTNATYEAEKAIASIYPIRKNAGLKRLTGLQEKYSQ